MDLESKGGSVELSTPAGRLLQRFIATLPKTRAFTITVFGSAPLQIIVDPTLVSADVDIFSDDPDLNELAERARLTGQHAEFHLQVGSELNFRTSPRWRARAQSLKVDHCTVVIPAPLDILIAKLNRLDEKDLDAFRVVRAKTGHPTETELIEELQFSVDLFRPAFDEEQAFDFATNCRRLWPVIFGREIDPRLEIIVPALKKRDDGYGGPARDYKQEIRDAVQAYDRHSARGA